MTDSLQSEIEAAVLRPQSTNVDGEQITERSLSDQIAAAKFIGAQNAVEGVSQGLWPFATFKIRPPGGRDRGVDC